MIFFEKMQQTLAAFNQPFHQIEAPSQLLVSKSCGLSSGVSQLLHGNCQFLSAKKAASTLQSTSCCNEVCPRLEGKYENWVEFFYDFPKVENIPKETANIFESTCRNQWQAENPSPEFGILVEFLW